LIMNFVTSMRLQNMKMQVQSNAADKIVNSGHGESATSKTPRLELRERCVSYRQAVTAMKLERYPTLDLKI